MKPAFIEDEAGLKALRFDGDGDAIQSLIDPQRPERLVMRNLQYLMSLLLFIPPPERILLLGVGGGALLQFLRHHYPGAHVTGVEIDADLLQRAQEELGLPPADKRLHYCIADAAEFIHSDRGRYDLIVTDIFNGPQSPDWVLQADFLQAVQQRLTEQGGAGWNLLIGSEQRFTRFYRELRRVFRQQTLCLEEDDHENLLALALNFEPPVLEMGERLQQAVELGDRLKLPLTEALAKIYQINPVGSGIL